MTARKPLKEVTWVLGEQPTRTQRRQLTWTNGCPVGKAAGRKVGKQHAPAKSASY